MTNTRKIKLLILNPNSSRAMTEGMQTAVSKVALYEVLKIS